MNTELSKKLTTEEIESFGKELEEIRNSVLSSVGEQDAEYIRKIDQTVKYYEIMGRLFLHFSLEPVSWMIGTGLLGVSKIINNMELGHNVMHGQYDWMNDPHLNSQKFDWDNVAEKKQWQFSHNYMHHTYTNILGKDHDFGYGIFRLSPDQKWRPIYVTQVFTNMILSLIFQYGVGNHGRDVEYHELPRKQRTKENKTEIADRFEKKKQKLIFRDYLLFPALAGLGAPKVFLGNLIANTMRNIWAHGIIFCGHFTEQTETFTYNPEETKGDWYLRQLKGSSNLSGGEQFYMLTGHLSHQIEHHMFPDIPANRYEEIAPRVQEICKRYGQNYNTGSFFSQYISVWKRILAYSFPNSVAEKIMAA